MTRDRDHESGEPQRDEDAVVPGPTAGFDAPRHDEGGEPLRTRLRRRSGLSERRWNLLVSALVALPYPVFVYVYLTFSPNTDVFIAVTLLYSLLAMYLSFSL